MLRDVAADRAVASLGLGFRSQRMAGEKPISLPQRHPLEPNFTSRVTVYFVRRPAVE